MRRLHQRTVEAIFRNLLKPYGLRSLSVAREGGSKLRK
jgi:hypothetical protein